VRKISPPPGFDLRIFQPVATRYADWAIYTRVGHSIACVCAHRTLWSSSPFSNRISHVEYSIFRGQVSVRNAYAINKHVIYDCKNYNSRIIGLLYTVTQHTRLWKYQCKSARTHNLCCKTWASNILWQRWFAGRESKSNGKWHAWIHCFVTFIVYTQFTNAASSSIIESGRPHSAWIPMLQVMSGICLKNGQDSSLPHVFQFAVHKQLSRI
jgi:hypothetical protein